MDLIQAWFPHQSFHASKLIWFVRTQTKDKRLKIVAICPVAYNIAEEMKKKNTL
jgi:hypothetical protein